MYLQSWNSLSSGNLKLLHKQMNLKASSSMTWVNASNGSCAGQLNVALKYLFDLSHN